MPVQLTTSNEIGVWLDSYNDLFSDFDPRPYQERTLSDDFISHTKRIAKSKNIKAKTLKLLLPGNTRNQNDEEVIGMHLHIYFEKVYWQLKEQIQKTNRRGIILMIAGILFMLTASYISFLKPERYFMHVLRVLFEPAGWFLLWMGMDHLFYFSRTSKKEMSFYSQMARINIEFGTY